MSKCKGVCRTYTPLQEAYADILQNQKEVVEFETNVALEGEEYTCDFLFKKVKEQWKENSNPLKHKGFQRVCVAVNRSVLTQCDYR